MILKKHIRKTILIPITLFAATLSACEASSFPAIAFTNDGPEIYIDITEQSTIPANH